MDLGLSGLAAHWREEADTLRTYGAAPQADVLERCAAELDLAVRAYSDEPLTINQAAQASSYSESHLRDLVRAGEIPNAGRKNSPRIRRRDLPRKPGVAS